MNTSIREKRQYMIEVLDQVRQGRPVVTIGTDILVFWIANSHDRRGSRMAPGAAVFSQQPGGPTIETSVMAANSEAVLANGMTEAISKATIDRDFVGRPSMLFVAPHDMALYLERLRGWRERNDWAHADGKVWHAFDSAWGLIDGYIIAPQDEDDLAEHKRLRALARVAAKKIA